VKKVIIFVFLGTINQALLIEASGTGSSLTITNATGRRLDVSVEYLDTTQGPCPDNSVQCYIRRDIWPQLESGLTRSRVYPLFYYRAVPPTHINDIFQEYPRANGSSAVTSIKWAVGGRVGQVRKRDLLYPNFIIRDAGYNYEPMQT
jgi:hypothetical protein